MPAFDLRGIKIAKYVNTNGTITYTSVQKLGDAMTVNMDLKRAEGRLYAESTLAEYMSSVTGGTISIGVKYITEDAKKLLFGATEKSTTAGSKTVSGLKYTAKDEPAAVGVAFYAPDMIDGALKYSCVFARRCLFGAPSMNFTTKGESIQFSTPTTTGELMADHSTDQAIMETATCDTEADAKAWITAVLA